LCVAFQSEWRKPASGPHPHVVKDDDHPGRGAPPPRSGITANVAICQHATSRAAACGESHKLTGTADHIVFSDVMLQGCPINRTIRNGCVALKNYRMGSGCDRVIEIERSAAARVEKFGSPCMVQLVRTAFQRGGSNLIRCRRGSVATWPPRNSGPPQAR
jgi:hypothetical protein